MASLKSSVNWQATSAVAPFGGVSASASASRTSSCCNLRRFFVGGPSVGALLLAGGVSDVAALRLRLCGPLYQGCSEHVGS
eukprot:15462585-Alexandrium_andersonii.AAC.1